MEDVSMFTPHRRSPKKARQLLTYLIIASLSVCWTASIGWNQVNATPILERSPLSSISHNSDASLPSTSESNIFRPSSEAVTTTTTTTSMFKRDTTPEETLYAVVQRLLPTPYKDHFQFKLNPSLVPASSTNIYDTFRVSNDNGGGKVVIEGASMAGLGAGLNYYLRNICKVEMSWSGDRFMDMPAVPPMINGTEGTIRASFVPWRYYMNVVTFGYSYVFWDWKRWERELDWMFLNGVNMALAMVGQEYIFRQMYESLGLTREELNGFFAAPTFMPWQRMGNIQGSWISSNDTLFKNNWIDSQWEIQGQILSRMHDFNITAIFPSFNGFVPRGLVRKYPDVKFQNASDWGGFFGDPYSPVSFIASTEPFFTNLTQQYLQTQASLYQQKGLDSHADKNYYLLDLFNEMHPVCMTVECLQQTTSSVMRALKVADPKAVWVMQSWFLQLKDIWKESETKAFFEGIRQVNDGRDAFVIDLYSDVIPLWNSTQGFFGIDWGWSMLNNFGGGQGLYGTLPTLLTEPFKGYQQPAKKMRGVGITMEGINNNEYLYQVVLDIPWESVEATYPGSVSSNTTTETKAITSLDLKQPPLNPQEHLESYLKRRYGPQSTSNAMLNAWTTLSQTVWDCRTGQMAQSKSYLDVTPALDMYRPGFLTTKFWYDQSKVVHAWSQLVSSTVTKKSKLRVGNGPIQDSVVQTIKSTSQKPGQFPDPKDPYDEIIASLPNDPTTRKSTLLGRFSQKLRGAFQNTLGQRNNRGPVADSINTLTTSLASPLPEEADLPLNISSFQYDLVDVTREVMLAIVLPGLHAELVDAYKAKDLDRTRTWGKYILNCIKDTDRILSTHSHFMLGPWIRDARAYASAINSSATLDSTEQQTYQDYLEGSARNQITWWGPVGQKGLADYASKHWGGLVKGYYYQRWEIFVDRLTSAVQKGQKLDYQAYLADSLKAEGSWMKETSNSNNLTYPVDPVEDTSHVAQYIWKRWGTIAARLAAKSQK
ncbi:hypothetical protein BGZ46_001406 [Entomortierella lignicola]|nr:hypothetical protein BGZ46_001406 [Entomortierella lignicola]